MELKDEITELVSWDDIRSNGLSEVPKASTFSSDIRDVLHKFLPLLVAKTLDMLAHLWTTKLGC